MSWDWMNIPKIVGWETCDQDQPQADAEDINKYTENRDSCVIQLCYTDNSPSLHPYDLMRFILNKSWRKY